MFLINNFRSSSQHIGILPSLLPRHINTTNNRHRHEEGRLLQLTLLQLVSITIPFSLLWFDLLIKALLT